MFSDTLKILRNENGLTQETLSQKIGISRSAISMYENGQREPDLETLETIADFFNVDMDYLVGKSKIKNRYQQTKTRYAEPSIAENIVTFPIISDIAAGYDNIMIEEYDNLDTIEVPVSYLHGRPKEDFIALRVHGDSMYPLYMDGDKVLIKRTPTLERSGEIGAIQYDDCATLKKIEYVKGENWLRMIPINPTYMPKVISGPELEQCHIIGVPVLLVRDMQQEPV